MASLPLVWMAGRRIGARAVARGAVRRRVTEDHQELARQGIAAAEGHRRGVGRVGVGLEERPVVSLRKVSAIVGGHRPDRRRERRAARHEPRRQEGVGDVARHPTRHGRVVTQGHDGEPRLRDRELDGRADVVRVGLRLGDRAGHARRRVDRDDDVGPSRQAVEGQGLVDGCRGARDEGRGHRARGQRVRRGHRDRGNEPQDGRREDGREAHGNQLRAHRSSSSCCMRAT